jgi:hypothetical protein
MRPPGFSSGTKRTPKILVSRTIRANRFVYDDATMYRMSWTDERMDDFAKQVGQRFDAVDKRLDRLDDRFDALQRTLMLTGGGIIATLIAGIVSVVVTQL